MVAHFAIRIVMKERRAATQGRPYEISITGEFYMQMIILSHLFNNCNSNGSLQAISGIPTVDNSAIWDIIKKYIKRN